MFSWQWGPSPWSENSSDVVSLGCRFGLSLGFRTSCVVVLPGCVFRIDRWCPVSDAFDGGPEVVCGMGVVFVHVHDFHGIEACLDHQSVYLPDFPFTVPALGTGLGQCLEMLLGGSPWCGFSRVSC